MGNHELMPATQRHDLVHNSLITNAGGGVMGIAENKKPELLPDTQGKTIQIRAPALLLIEEAS